MAGRNALLYCPRQQEEQGRQGHQAEEETDAGCRGNICRVTGKPRLWEQAQEGLLTESRHITAGHF